MYFLYTFKSGMEYEYCCEFLILNFLAQQFFSLLLLVSIIATFYAKLKKRKLTCVGEKKVKGIRGIPF